MPSQRIRQINELIKEELGSIITKEIEFSSGSLVTISKVETSPDLKHANILLSILPFSTNKEARQVIEQEKGNIQKLLNSRLKMKFSPRIHFRLDESEEKAEYITNLLDTINK
ncbi:30S ribosome-binding factor RbfA [Patescibacteria group bacterium]|nr:30S ribosome-binding factor RbfA [Patescibacteria group bacterium]MBU1951547.1 30S ribosome-binding factor RbfA [Patescibacteria group bacterium]MBU2228854.1 30S ribosome-binding factor RbfA [Patescibacteria group bacterium]MBU2235823.1 30S ribosome-binding factor RbfA [Patescibacteria group bacterium]